MTYRPPASSTVFLASAISASILAVRSARFFSRWPSGRTAICCSTCISTLPPSCMSVPTRHVGGNGHRSGCPPGDDKGFLFVEPGVGRGGRSCSASKSRTAVPIFNRHSAHKDRLFLLRQARISSGIALYFRRPYDRPHRLRRPGPEHVCRDIDDFEAVDLGEFTGFVIAVPVMPTSLG